MFIKNNGFDVLVVWENKYRLNRNKIVDECIIFLEGQQCIQ